MTQDTHPALTAARSLAAAGQLDVASATALVATAMNQFGLEGKDLTDYPPLVCIEWEDATNIALWRDLKDAIKWATTHDFTVRTVGYLIHEDDHCVVVAARYSPDPDEGDDVGLFERLPKGMIVRRWTLDKEAMA